MAHEQLESARGAVRRAIDAADREDNHDVREVLRNVDSVLAELDRTDETLREDRLAEVKQQLNRVQNDVTGELGSFVTSARGSIIDYEKATT